MEYIKNNNQYAAEMFAKEVSKYVMDIFNAVIAWTLEDNIEQLNYKPKNGGWSNLEVLEHITLTNKFLLVLIEKSKDKALKNTQTRSLDDEVGKFNFDLSRFDNVKTYKSFEWNRPNHHEPTGEKNIEDIEQTLFRQEAIVQSILIELNKGQGFLYLTTMSVDNLGKLNVYEYILFLCYHIERHIQQLLNNDREYCQ